MYQFEPDKKSEKNLPIQKRGADSSTKNVGLILEDNRPQIALQKKQIGALSNTPVQKKKNNTGLPDNLKSGIENLSGYSMDDVKVHYNSDKPAQLNAYAYAQGTDIHIASGQEKHLPHEAWHVVQQKQGRVKPTVQMKGKVNVNDNSSLEKEADAMGGKALQFAADGHYSSGLLKRTTTYPVLQGFFMYDSNRYRVSDDGLMAVYLDQPRGGHAAYALHGRAAASNATRANSRVRLYEPGSTRAFPNITNTQNTNLNTVLARNLTTGTEGNAMTLERDCGVSSSQVMGGYDHTYAHGALAGVGARRGVHSGNQLTAGTNSPASMQLEIMRAMFTQRRVVVNGYIANGTLAIQQHAAEIVRLTQVRADTNQLIQQNRDALLDSENYAAGLDHQLDQMHPDYSYYERLEDDLKHERNYSERQEDLFIRIQRRREYDRDYTPEYVAQRIREYGRRRINAQRDLNRLYGRLTHFGNVRRLLTDYENMDRDSRRHQQEAVRLRIEIDRLRGLVAQTDLSIAAEQNAHQVETGRRTDNTQFVQTLTDAINAAAAEAGGAEAAANHFIRSYRNFNPAEREHLESLSRINEFATPDVGEAYVIARGGDVNPIGGGGWNFHWGAVVLRSGGDTITLENDASTAPAGANTGWRFQMYGTRRNETFHWQNNNGNTYNTDPTTIRVRI